MAVPLDAAQPPERPMLSIASPSSVGVIPVVPLIEADEESPLPPFDAPRADSEEWNRIESASLRANASLESIADMLGNLGEAVSISQALVTLDLIPYGEVRAHVQTSILLAF